jgi:cell division protein FtsB
LSLDAKLLKATHLAAAQQRELFRVEQTLRKLSAENGKLRAAVVALQRQVQQLQQPRGDVDDAQA